MGLTRWIGDLRETQRNLSELLSENTAEEQAASLEIVKADELGLTPTEELIGHRIVKEIPTDDYEYDEKDKRVEEAYDQGMLTDQEYRRALQLGWYGEHLKKMDNYLSKPPQHRAAYLDKQVYKKIRKNK